VAPVVAPDVGFVVIGSFLPPETGSFLPPEIGTFLPPEVGIVVTGCLSDAEGSTVSLRWWTA
jgi:hypothetical protein